MNNYRTKMNRSVIIKMMAFIVIKGGAEKRYNHWDLTETGAWHTIHFLRVRDNGGSFETKPPVESWAQIELGTQLQSTLSFFFALVPAYLSEK